MAEIAVLLKQVPDTTARITVSGDRVDENAITSWVTSPYDEYSLEAALQHKEAAGGSITAITLGPARADKVLKDAAALGVEKLVRVWQDDWESLDSIQVQAALAVAVQASGAEYVYCGKQAADTNQGSTGPGVAEIIGAPCIVEITDFDVSGPSFTRSSATGSEKVTVAAPAVLTFSKTTTELRRPNVRGIMMAKRAQIEVVGGEVGATNVSVVRHASPAQKPPGKTFEGADSVPEVVGLLRDEAKVI
jgi:electron transfer flavoprotein beta subunit